MEPVCLGHPEGEARRRQEGRQEEQDVNGPIPSQNSSPGCVATPHLAAHVLSVRGVILLLQARIEWCVDRGALILLHTVDVLRDAQLMVLYTPR